MLGTYKRLYGELDIDRADDTVTEMLEPVLTERKPLLKYRLPDRYSALLKIFGGLPSCCVSGLGKLGKSQELKMGGLPRTFVLDERSLLRHPIFELHDFLANFVSVDGKPKLDQ